MNQNDTGQNNGVIVPVCPGMSAWEQVIGRSLGGPTSATLGIFGQYAGIELICENGLSAPRHSDANVFSIMQLHMRNVR